MATKQQQIETIRAMAYNDVAREIEAEGIELTYAQADRVGAAGLAWLSDRLGLRVTETDVCVRAEVRS